MVNGKNLLKSQQEAIFIRMQEMIEADLHFHTRKNAESEDDKIL